MNEKERLCFPYEDKEINSSDFVCDMKQIYEKMQDDISKEIFVNRLLFSMTGDHKYLKNVLMHTNGGKKLHAIIEENEKVYIYGAGIRGKRLVELFPDKIWCGIIDKNSKMENYNDVAIINLEQFIKDYELGVIVLVSNMKETEAIAEELQELGVCVKDIYVLNDFDEQNVENIYFELDRVKQAVDSTKLFIDVGCYDGKDTLKYMQWCENTDAPIWAFEPDTENYCVCKNNLKNFSNIELFNIGLSDVEENVAVMGEGEMSYLVKTEASGLQTRLLDTMVENQSVGFVKMDVEGYEENVLKGACKMICRDHPVMAVSIYHKKSDIWRLPKLLLGYNENYCFYMRHYSASNGDTVLYAIDGK